MNQSPVPHHDDEKVVDFAEHPGRRLRNQRLARGLEIERIASQLHLKRETVEALEQDRYADLPDAVFIAGYMRNYARLLGIDPAPIVEAFRAQRPDPHQTASQPAPRGRAPGDPAPGGRMLLFAIALLLAGGLVVWWQTGFQGWDWEQASPLDALTGLFTERSSSSTDGPAALGEPDEAELIDPTPDTASPPPVLSDLALRDADRLAGLDSPDGTAPRPPEGSSTPESVQVVPPPPTPTPALPVPVVIGPDPAVTIEQPVTAPVAAVAPAVTDPSPARPEPEPPAADPREIVLEFTGTSWVDVRDADRRGLLTGEMKSGDRRVLTTGTPPFSVVIGNVNATRMTVGGEPFDLRQRARGNVARFSFTPANATAD